MLRSSLTTRQGRPTIALIGVGLIGCLAISPMIAYLGGWDSSIRISSRWIGGQSTVSTVVEEGADQFLDMFALFVARQNKTEAIGPDHSTGTNAFCTASVEQGQVQVNLNGEDVGHLERLESSKHHSFQLRSICNATFPGIGDFYESLVDNEHYRSRVKFEPPYDGTGNFRGHPLRLPSQLDGTTVRIRIWRLYREYEGILIDKELRGQFYEGPYARELLMDKVVQVMSSTSSDIGVSKDTSEPLQELPLCTKADYRRRSWIGGYWYRSELTDESWTFHLPHCRYQRLTQEQASECLNGRWIGFLGDSTTQDMMRNTLWTFLGDAYPFAENKPLPKNIPRHSDFNLTHPNHPDRWTRMSTAFNGHYDTGSNRLGMQSFRNKGYLATMDRYFERSDGVDTFIVNSGLHDAWNRPTPESFMKEFDNGWKYYMDKILDPKKPRPAKIVYRFSVTPPVHLEHYNMVTPMNPASLEMINLLERDYLKEWESTLADADPDGEGLTYLDSYEITFPWHFDDEMNQGPHYGRPFWDNKKKVVDDTMVQIFLNDIC